MAANDPSQVQRREFLQAGTVVTASALAVGPGSPSLGDEPKASKSTLPTRKLGKTGVEVSILNQGTWRAPGALERILRFAYANGVRYFDTAKVYGSEPGIAKWFQAMPEVRKSIFLVTKDTTRTAGDATRTASLLPKMLDERLAELQTDYIDLFFIHGLGDHHSVDQAVNLVKSRELKETIDAIMLQYTPWLDKEAPLNKALDACWKKGIGLISMKQVAGQFFGDKAKGNILEDVVRRVPMLAEKKLSPFQGLLHAIWTDERISSVCTSMRNTDQIRENADAARRFEPLKAAELSQLRDASLAHGPTLCADCEGRCMAAAGTAAELGNLTRFLTYHEHHGDRAEARRQYANLSPEARDWSGADLDAARAACPSRLDFARLLPEVDRHLA